MITLLLVILRLCFSADWLWTYLSLCVCIFVFMLWTESNCFASIRNIHFWKGTFYSGEFSFIICNVFNMMQMLSFACCVYVCVCVFDNVCVFNNRFLFLLFALIALVNEYISSLMNTKKSIQYIQLLSLHVLFCINLL